MQNILKTHCLIYLVGMGQELSVCGAVVYIKYTLVARTHINNFRDSVQTIHKTEIQALKSLGDFIIIYAILRNIMNYKQVLRKLSLQILH